MQLSDIQVLAERIRAYENTNLNEANTKISLILPLLQMLGYDIFDHNEVAQEYTSDFGQKKGEKVDLVILRQGSPVILIECKPLDDPLKITYCTQLFRYFVTQTASLAILTNGRHYLFFSDFEKKNVMDTKPFMEIDLLNLDPLFINELNKLTKNNWNLDSFLSSAKKRRLIHKIKEIINIEINDPSNDIVRYFVSKCYSGRITTNIIENFYPIVKIAFSEYIADRITQEHVSLYNAWNNSLHKIYRQNNINGDVTPYHIEEYAYNIICTILKNNIDPNRLYMRCNKSYSTILLDNNNRKSICRLYNFQDCEGKIDYPGENAFIYILTESNDNGIKSNLQTIHDLYSLSVNLIQALNRHIKSEAQNSNYCLQKHNRALLGQDIAIFCDTTTIVVTTAQNADLSVFSLYNNGKIRHDTDFIFYGQKNNHEQSIILDDAEDGKSVVTINLLKVNCEIDKIVFALTRDDLPISILDTLYLSVNQRGACQFEYNLNLQQISTPALILGAMYKKKDEWRFKFLGQGLNGTLEYLAKSYGVDIQ